MIPTNCSAQAKKECPPAVHVPIEPTGMNQQGSMHFSQGLLPSSCWLVVPSSALIHPQVPVPQIQVMNSMDYVKIIEIACADLAVTTKLKRQKSKPAEMNPTREYISHLKDQFERSHYSRALAMLNSVSGAQSSQSTSPISMSPRASNDR
ncbi:Mediator complex subunit 15 [Caenorhabditis elegans]|uniref:Mediator complex subunit 15 n=1 Tax=Caenorhabditis elegans TaxID=6239 RepID=Q4W4Z8_CAEEL|nr:Mediator complex subunit 15 [Caenorhabditis elegans]CCD73588.1 Mediator complex subunit 15 [Caenorhabditis elegans]|eukprot:NP_001022313.1 Uncharacterized protein CELE_T05A8.8 [Caenorhabditis elegans]